MSSTAPALATGRRASMGRILRAGLLAGVLAAVVNVLIGLVAASLLNTSDQFGPFQWFAVVPSSIAGALAATAVFALLSRFTRRPVRLFTIIAAVALVLSFSNPLIIMGSQDPRFAGATWPVVLVLMLMHVVVAVFSVRLLTATARDR